jgi:signal transduction histidine kinase
LHLTTNVGQHIVVTDKMDLVSWDALKWILMKRLAVLSAGCTAIVVVLIAAMTVRDAQSSNTRVADALDAQLKLQLLRIDSALDTSSRFPDWGAVIDYILLPGQCAEFRPTTGLPNGSCFGQEGKKLAPNWFESLLAQVYPVGVDTKRRIEHNGVARGTVVASLSRQALASQVYNSLVPVLSAWLAAVAMSAGLIYLAVGQALRPAERIMEAIQRLADGNFACRIGPYRVRELDQLAAAFNRLAEKLESATKERNDMARRLVNASEEERRRFARDLHDDVAQRLTALCGLATSIKTELNVKNSELAGEADQMLAIASKAMGSVRETLGNLRPQELDDLGLIVALDGLVSSYRRRRTDGPILSFSSSEGLESLPPEAAGHVYRIVQEAVSNAVRHAEASSITVSIARNEGNDGEDSITLVVADDGKGIHYEPEQKRDGGLGLAGMRERALALNGKFSIMSTAGRGTQVSVVFPLGALRPEHG